VARFKQAIAGAAAVLIVTPEYNHSVPGVLQNAIDWASRPGGNSVLKGKPVGIMSASPGAIGGARAQQQLKLVMLSTLSPVLPHPGVVVGQAKEKFDEAGSLTHEPTRQFVAAYLQALEVWTQRIM
jgi:chromate reductase